MYDFSSAKETIVQPDQGPSGFVILPQLSEHLGSLSILQHESHLQDGLARQGKQETLNTTASTDPKGHT